MTDKFILSLDNFKTFNKVSDFPISEELVFSDLNLFKKIKNSFSNFYLNNNIYLLLKDERSVSKIIHGDFYPCSQCEIRFKFFNYDKLSENIILNILVNDTDKYLKHILKKDLKLFLDILDINHKEVKVYI